MSFIDQFGLRPASGVIALLAVYFASWVLLRLGGPLVAGFIQAHLALTPARAIGPEPWQLVTAGFFAGTLKAIFYLAITLLFFGNTIEQLMGPRGLWKVWVAGVIGGGLALGLLGRAFWPDATTFVTAAPGTAILVAYAVRLSGQQVLLFGQVPMRAGSMAWIWVGISVVGALLDYEIGGPVLVIIELVEIAGGGLAGWLVARRGGVSLSGVGTQLDKLKLWRMRRRYRVLDGGRAKPDKRYLN
jgi:membrane associated rhomboid family serine protease